MKLNANRWLLASGLATLFLTGCVHEYADRDDYRHHRGWEHDHHRYEGRPPVYEHGADIYVTPEPGRPNRW